jgi:hypothetical protein
MSHGPISVNVKHRTLLTILNFSITGNECMISDKDLGSLAGGDPFMIEEPHEATVKGTVSPDMNQRVTSARAEPLSGFLWPILGLPDPPADL